MDEIKSFPAATKLDFIGLTSDIVSAYVSNNSVRPSDLPTLLAEMHGALAKLSNPAASAEPGQQKPSPAQIKKSIMPDALVSFIDGKKYKALRRHLNTHGLTFDAYRERFGLPRDYPVVAASYSAQRSKLAHALGLGQQRRKAAAKVAEVAETVTEVPKARGRKKAAEPAPAPAEKPARGRKSKKATATL